MIGQPHLERVRNLQLWLDAHGLEVVKGGWDAGWAYPVIYVRRHGTDGAGLLLTDPPACRCGHGLAYHGCGGGCLVQRCRCEVYAPAKDKER